MNFKHGQAGQRAARIPAIVTLALLCVGENVALADISTPEDDCLVRNLAQCEFIASGVQSFQPGPCPAGARTLKPAGTENCSDPATTSPPAPMSQDVAHAKIRGTKPDWIAGVKRWLLPVLIYSVLGCAVLLVVWRWRHRRAGPQSTAKGSAVAKLISAVCAVLAGWKAASAAFKASFNAYENHDSAAPLLLASPVWLATFVIVAAGVFALLMLAWRLWARTARSGR